jgi:predicted DNA-binding transcriptional regulator AlpA
MEKATTHAVHLDVPALAARWLMPEWSIYKLVREKKLPALRIGRRVRFRLSDIERFEEGQVQGQAKAKKADR